MDLLEAWGSSTQGRSVVELRSNPLPVLGFDRHWRFGYNSEAENI